MKKFFVIITLLTIVSCAEKKEVELFEVEYYGALKKMMYENDISGKVDLADYKDKEHFYALGAIENLKGEIQIFDSESFNSQVEGSDLAIDKTFDKKAALLVGAYVSEWISIDIPRNIISYEELEIFVEEQAKLNRINTDEPFPFLIDGKVDSYDWHIIDWVDGDTVHTHEKHVDSGLNGSQENVELNMLGFYSNSHHAVFTHHTTNMHIHFKTYNGDLAGHVDGLVLGEDMVLKLPVVPEN